MGTILASWCLLVLGGSVGHTWLFGPVVSEVFHDWVLVVRQHSDHTAAALIPPTRIGPVDSGVWSQAVFNVSRLYFLRY